MKKLFFLSLALVSGIQAACPQEPLPGYNEVPFSIHRKNPVTGEITPIQQRAPYSASIESETGHEGMHLGLTQHPTKKDEKNQYKATIDGVPTEHVTFFTKTPTKGPEQTYGYIKAGKIEAGKMIIIFENGMAKLAINVK